MAIIAFIGKAGSGKDTVATIVQELYPEMNWQIKGFADKLRQVASLLTGIPAEEMKRQHVKEKRLGKEWNFYRSWYRYDGRRYDVDRKFISAEESIAFASERDGYAEDCEEFEMTLRQFLQELGTNAVRDKLHPNSWVNALMCDYKSLGQSNPRAIFMPGFMDVDPNWLITDCRFPNELEAIKSRGGTCIRIVRPDNPYPKSNHESETALDGVELLTIINDGSLEQLRLRVKEVFDPIVKNLGNAKI